MSDEFVTANNEVDEVLSSDIEQSKKKRRH
jgi:hypothetical protein